MPQAVIAYDWFALIAACPGVMSHGVARFNYEHCHRKHYDDKSQLQFMRKRTGSLGLNRPSKFISNIKYLFSAFPNQTVITFYCNEVEQARESCCAALKVDRR